MAKETIEAVKRAEEAAMSVQQDADQQCSRLLEAAAEERQRLLDDTRGKARAATAATLRDAEREAESIREAAAQKAAQQVSALDAAASAARPAAVDAVIGAVI